MGKLGYTPAPKPRGVVAEEVETAMGISQIAMMVAVLAVIGGYWWWTTGRHGSKATQVHLGLRPDEEIRRVFSGFFKLNFKASDVAIAAVGMERVAKAFTMTLTGGGELVFRPTGDEPQRFQQGQFRLSMVKENDTKLVGSSGGQEPADVYEVSAAGMQPFHIQLARTAAQEIQTWND